MNQSDGMILIESKIFSFSIGIAPTRNCTHFLKLDSWSPGAGSIHIISTKGINQIKKGNCKKKKLFYAYKKNFTFLNKWVQFRVGAIFFYWNEDFSGKGKVEGWNKVKFNLPNSIFCCLLVSVIKDISWSFYLGFSHIYVII